MASSNIARLGIVLGVDTAELEVKISKAKQEFGSFAKQIQRDSDNAAKDIVALRYATEDYGKTLTKVEQVEREIKAGRYQRAEGTLIEALRKEAAAYDAKANAMKNMAGAQFKMNEQQKLQMTYQATDLFTQIASGQSPFIAIIQQGGQLKDSMGGLGNMFKALGSFITPVSVGMTAFAATVGAVAYAIYEADKEFDKFQDSLTLTGNYAGVTAKELVAMSTAVANASNTTIGKATEALETLVASGKFTKTSLESVTNAVLVYAKIAGVDGKVAAEKLMSGLDGTASSAKQLNDKMNFLTLAQYKQIEALDKAGKEQEAAKLAADILTGRMEAQKRILGETEGAWDKATRALSGYWDTFKKALFSGESPEDKLEKMNNQIKVLQTGLRNATGDEPFFVGKTKELDALLKRRDELADLINQRDQSVVKANEKPGIDAYATAGGIKKETELKAAIQKAIANNAYLIAIESANEIQKVELEATKELEEKRLEFSKKTDEEKRVFGGLLARQLDAEIYTIELKRDEKLRAIRTKQAIAQFQAAEAFKEQNNAETTIERTRREALEKAARDQTTNMEYQRESLELKYQMIYATETEQKLAQISLEYARKRKEVEGQNPIRLAELDKQEAMEKMFVSMNESAKRTQQVFDSVFGNLSSAIDNFVKTGKLSMKDLARSVIQDLIAIQMKAAALKFLGYAFGNISAASTYGTVPFSEQTNMLAAQEAGFRRAAGGSVTNNTPYVVGERGPELFVPSGSGTIIPNGQMGSMGGTTNVTNYNINAIDTKSFEDRLLGSSNAIWAANQYAGKSMPTNFGRT